MVSILIFPRVWLFRAGILEINQLIMNPVLGTVLNIHAFHKLDSDSNQKSGILNMLSCAHLSFG